MTKLNGAARDIRHFSGSLIVFFLVVLILYYLAKYTIPEQNAQIINTLIGMIAASIAMVIQSITGQKKDMQIDFLIREKDRLEGMIIDLQKQILENYDNTLDRVLLSESLKYDIKNNPPKSKS